MLAIFFISLLLFFISVPVTRGLIVDGKVYSHKTASFGPSAGTYNVTAEIILAAPEEFCPHGNMSGAAGKIILIYRSPQSRADGCYFSDKARAAQSSPTNAVAMIVGDNIAGEGLFLMNPDSNFPIYIPSVLVTHNTYTILKEKLNSSANNKTYAMLNDQGEVGGINILLFLLVILFGSVIVLYTFKNIFQRCQHRQRRIARASSIPSIKYSRIIEENTTVLIRSESDRRIHNDSCAICLEDFGRNEKIKLLPCDHGFHPVCLDPWFKRSELCPICKSSIMKHVTEEKTSLQVG